MTTTMMTTMMTMMMTTMTIDPSPLRQVAA